MGAIVVRKKGKLHSARWIALCVCLPMLNTTAATQPTPPGAPTIYKLIDANGKVTYTNSPVKGGKKVELEPITVIPTSPAASLGAAPVVANAKPPAPVLIPVSPAEPVIATSPTKPTVATVTPISKAQLQGNAGAPAIRPPSVAASPAPTLPVVKLSPNVTVAKVPVAAPIATITQPAAAAVAKPTTPVTALLASAAPSADAITQKRREELRLRALTNDIAREEKLLTAARGQLSDEKKNSESFRKLRVSLSSKSVTAGQLPAVNAEGKAKVERHFERVRDLQDQVNMHERNLEGLRKSDQPVKVAAR